MHERKCALFYALEKTDDNSSVGTHELTNQKKIRQFHPDNIWGFLRTLERKIIFAILVFAVTIGQNAIASNFYDSSERRTVNKEKRLGQIFTPQYLVEDILDFAGYSNSNNILEKHIIDNSCGDGVFLCEIVRRYCTAYSSLHGKSNRKKLAQQLGEFIHGIEIDAISYSHCIENLNRIANDFDLPPVAWDIQNADTMTICKFDGCMDFVVGNPPYVRVHNLNANLSRVKRYQFCDGGMTDLYLVFYEIGLKMLAKHGRLCYIAPSSWINSVAGKNMREYLRHSGCLKGIIDLQHFQPFNATTYTAICLLENSCKSDKFSYSVYDSPKTIRHIDDLKYEDAFFDGALYLGDKRTLQSFRSIKTAVVPSCVEVKNGFATLADGVFISNAFPFNSMTIPVIKASTGKWRKAFYPYDKHGKPLSRNEIFANKCIAEYLEQHKNLLLKGRNELTCPDWYLYGRTQALKDVWTNKYSINTVVRDVSSIKFNAVPIGMCVYSVLYIISDVSEEALRTALLSDDFIKYISVLKKYKSGGYYTFNSKELKQYLDFKLSNAASSQHKNVNGVQQFLDFQ